MAKDNKNISPKEAEQAKRAKEEEARLDKEKKEQQKLREKKRKRKKQKMLKMQKKEQKRVKWLINLPFMTLFKVSTLITFLSFITIFFWSGTDLYYSLIYSFFIFTSIYLGVGLILVALFYLLSVDKEFELKEEIRLEKQMEIEEEEARQREEMKELEALERELTEKKLKVDSPTPELARNNIEDSESMLDEGEKQMPDFSDIQDSQEPDFFSETNNQTFDDNVDTSIPELTSRENVDNSYLEDIFGEEFSKNEEKV